MNHRKIINKDVEEKIKSLGTVEKTATITEDAKGLLHIRIPKSIQRALDIKKMETITFKAEKDKLTLIFRGEEYARKEPVQKKKQ